MVAISLISHRRHLLAAVLILLAGPWLVWASPASTSFDFADAQTHCAGPAMAFSREMNTAVSTGSVDRQLRSRFLENLEQCRAVYRYQLQQLAAEFDDLPASAYCHSVRREFVASEDLFDIAAMRARQLPLGNDEERSKAVDFFQQANAGVVRAVNGLFLLRHGICMEERIAPFDHPPFESDIDRTYPHIE